MKGCKGIGAGLIAVLLALAAGSFREPVRARESTRPGVLRIGLIGTLFRDTSEPLIQVMMRPFKSLLEAQAGVTGHLVASGDADKLGRQLKDDEVQLGVFHGFEFAWARLKDPKLKPLLIVVNQHRFLRAHLVVRRESKVEGTDSLKGQVVALARRSREHCRLYLERRCVPPGSTPQQFFARVTAPLDAEDALDDLVDGSVEAVVVDASELEGYQKRKPNRSSRVKTLHQSEPFPCGVIAYYPGSVSESLLQRVREGMIAAKNTRRGQQLLEMCRITAFEAVPDDYEQMLSDIVKAYPPLAEK
jgi:ABC-type phosphate/phosphonate transport system substrate-binding protein